jgi:hypothetical protein
VGLTPDNPYRGSGFEVLKPLMHVRHANDGCHSAIMHVAIISRAARLAILVHMYNEGSTIGENWPSVEALMLCTSIHLARKGDRKRRHRFRLNNSSMYFLASIPIPSPKPFGPHPAADPPIF